MAVRKVSNRGGNIIGHIPSLKLGRMVAYESLIERDFVYLLDYEPSIEHFSEQPLVIQYQHEGKMRKYTPDFYVVHGGDSYLFECKPVRFVSDPENQMKFEAARLWCNEQGWAFGIVTDDDLASNWRIANIKFLAQFARYAIEPKIKRHIITFLSHTSGPVKVSDVAQDVNQQEPQSIIVPILHMAFRHEVYIALDDEKITVDSLIALRDFSNKKGALLR